MAITTIALLGAALFAAYSLLAKVYDAFFGPLSKYPGPKLSAMLELPGIFTALRGHSGSTPVSLHRKYGPVVRVGPRELSYVGSAQVWNDIHGHQKAGGALKPYKDPKVYRRDPNSTASLMNADDADHSRMRKVLSPAFSERALKEQEPLLKGWSNRLIERLVEYAEGGNPVNIQKFYKLTTFDIMGDLCFGENLHMLDDVDDSWIETIFGYLKTTVFLSSIMAIHPVLEWIVKNVVMKVGKKLMKSTNEHWQKSGERLERRLNREADRPDFWKYIMAKEDGPQAFSRAEKHVTASLFMIAGTDTSSTALTGTTYYLLRNPDVLKKATSEVRNAFSSLEDMTLERLAQCKYLHACLQEGLRIYPSVPLAMTRTTPKGGAIINGEFVPENVNVGIHHLATGHSKQRFTRPEEFCPERWLGDEAFKNDDLDAMEAFSFGPRGCLGQNLAWHEMRLVLGSVLFTFDMELCPESKEWDKQKVFAFYEAPPLMAKLTPVSKEQ